MRMVKTNLISNEGNASVSFAEDPQDDTCYTAPQDYSTIGDWYHAIYILASALHDAHTQQPARYRDRNSDYIVGV